MPATPAWWWELHCLVPDGLAEDAAGLFVEAGAQGCETRSHDAPVPRLGEAISEPPGLAPAGMGNA